MSDLPTKTYPPSFVQAMIADHEAEQAGATTEDSSVVQTKGDAMSDDLVTLAPQKRRSKLTHWPGCETVHLECLLVKVSDKARALQDEVDRLKALIVSHYEVVQWAAEGWRVALKDHEQQAIEAIVQEAQDHEAAAKGGRDE